MGKKLRRFLSIFLSIAMVLGYIPCTGITAYAATLTSESTTWSENSVIAGDVTINNNVTVNADITLTIPEGKTLTINGQSDYTSYAAIQCDNNSILTVSGGGTLIVNAPAEEEGHPPFDGIDGNLIVDGANVQVTGGADGVYGNVTVKSGSVCVNGGNGEAGGEGFSGISGVVIVNGGSITVVGGNGGNGYNYDNGGNGGYGVTGDIIVTGGSATITGGNGGTKGSDAYAYNGYFGQAVSGSITGNAEESEDNTNWTTVTDNTSSKQYIKIDGGSAVASVDVNGVSLEPATAQTIDVDDKVAFTATITPDEATNKSVKWSVGGTNADAVKLYSDVNCTTEVGADATETLTVYAKGISAGNATVTCTSNADSEKSASCDVTVNAGNTTISYASLENTTTEITFDGKSWYLIDYDDSTVTLLSKECVGASQFGSENTYDGSTVESAVNNYYAESISTDAKTAVSDNKMFLLSTEGAKIIYNANSNVLKCSQASDAFANIWWLCSQGGGYYYAAVVNGDTGEVDDFGENLSFELGVRPALKLDLSKVTFDSESKTFSLNSASNTTEYTTLQVGDVLRVGDFINSTKPYIVGEWSFNPVFNPWTLVRADVSVSGIYPDQDVNVTESATGEYYLFKNDDGDYTIRAGEGNNLRGTYFTATNTSDGIYVASISHGRNVSVAVYEPVTGVTLNPSTSQTIDVDNKVSFTATVAPNNAFDKTVKWSVGGTNATAVKLYSDENCTTEVGTDATETLTIYAKGISAGSATVICTSNADSTKSASCDVTVNEAAPSKLTLNVGENGKVVMSSGIYGNGEENLLELNKPIDNKGTMIVADGHCITVHEGANVNILKPGNISFYPAANNTGTITAVPADGYAFTGWYNGETLYSENEALNYKDIGEDLTLTAKFVAKKNNPAVNDFTFIAPSDLGYNGISKSATVTAASGITGMGEVTVKYYSDAACTTEADPKNVGTYYVGITVTEGDNYNATTSVLHDSDWKFTIGKADAVAATVTANNRTYDGTEKPLVTVTGEATGGEMQYALGTATEATQPYTTSIPTATDAGTYYVWYKALGDDNHLDSESKCVEVKINAKTVTVNGITATDKVYDGTTSATLDYSNVTFYGKVDGDTLTVSATGTFASTNASESAQDVTISGIELGGDDANNYVLAETGNQDKTSAIITHKEVSLNWGTTTFTYNGEPQAPTCTAGDLVGTDSCTVTLVVNGDHKDAGNYVAEATGLSNPNYTLPATTTKSFSIKRAEISPTVTVGSWTYGGVKNNPVVVGNTENGTTTYVWKEYDAEDTTYATYDNPPTDAGTYTLKVMIAETANYNAGEATTNFSISKADVGISVTIEDSTYGDDSKTPSVSGYTGDVTYFYKKLGEKDSAYTTSVPKDAGTYVVKAEPNNANYLGATENFTIAKKTVTLSWTPASFSYDGHDKCPVATVTNKAYETDEVNVTVTGAATAAGKHTAQAVKLTGAAADNYELPENASYKFEITKSAIPDGLSVSIDGWTYGDEPNVPTVEGNVEGANVTYKYKAKGADDSTYTNKVPTKAGEYTVQATIAATAGYSEKSVTADFEIAKKTAEFAWEGDSFTYNGKKQVPKASVANAVPGDKLSVSVGINGSGIDVDGYTATAMAITGTNAVCYELPNLDDREYKYSITKAELIVTAEDKKVTYYDQAPAYTVTYSGFVDDDDETDLFGTVGFDCTYEAGSPVGTYDIIPKGLTSLDYDIIFEKGTLTVNKKAALMTNPVAKTDLTYNGAEQDLVTAGSIDISEGTIFYSVDGGAWQTEVPKAKDAGTYKVSWYLAPTDNYSSSSSEDKPAGEVKVTISPLQTKLVWTIEDNTSDTALVVIYDGTDKCPTATVGNKANDTDEVNVKVTGSATAVGNHTAEATKLTGAAANNYSLPEITEVEFEIIKATIDDQDDQHPYGAAVTLTGWTYGDEPNIPSIEGNKDGANVTYKYKAKGADDSTYTNKVPTKAGEYTVQATIAATAGYNEKVVTTDFTIAKKVAQISWSDTSLKYTGEAQGPKAEFTTLEYGDDVNAVYNYKLKAEEDSKYVEQVPTEAEDYTAKVVSLTGEDADNYVLPTTTTTDFSIAKGTLEPTVSISGWTYGDIPNAPTVEGNVAEADVTFSYKEKTAADSSYTADVPKAAGDYTVKATIAAKGSYEGGEATADFTIEKKAAKLTWSNISFTYDGQSHIPSAELANPASGDTITVEVSGEQTNAGEYVATATGLTGENAANYELPAITTQKFAIAKVVVTLTWDPVKFVYNGEDQCPTATVGNLVQGDEGKVSAKVTGTATAVGKHTAEATKLTGTAADNYSLPEVTEVTFKIVKADLVDAEIVLDDWTYGYSPNVPVISGNVEGGNVTFMYKAADAEDSAFTSTVPSLAGEYTVKAIISATAGYNGKTLTKNFKINKAPLNLVLTIEGWTYGEESCKPELTGNAENGELTYTYYVDSQCTTVTTADNNGAESDGAKPVFAGTYTLKAEVAETDNYLAGETTVVFTIKQRTLTIVAEDKTKVYGEDDPEFTYTQEGLVEGDEITGTLSRVEGSDVGKYDIILGTLTAGNNYAIAYTGAVLSITKANSVVTTAPEAKDLTYDGEEHALITAGEADGGTLMYAVGTDAETVPDETEFDTEVPAETNTDVYYVWYMVKGDKNHFNVDAACIKAEIKEVDKTDLNKAIDGSEKLLESMEGNDDYNDIAEALTEALEDAKKIAEDKNVTEDTVQTATEDIEEALEEATADKLAVDKDNFDEAKEAAKKAADNAAKSGDSAASKKLVTDAKAAINNLQYDETKSPEENQKAVDDIITKLEGKLKEQRSAEKRAAEEAADTKAAGNVVNMINNLPAPDKITKNDKAAIEAARNAYNALTAQQKAKINEQTLAKLANAEKALANASKYSGEWINGQWYETDGSANYIPKGEWKNNGTGWWYEDTAGWYPKSQWQKIDGKWYYFTADGYMDYSEYRDGYWLGSDGAWVEAYYGGKWMSKWENGAAGWWYTDASGWYPQNQYLWIDGVQYWFNENGITN